MSATQSKPAAPTALFMLAAFVLMEGPVRMLLATDPWLVEGSHWYFNQPLRIALEILFVGLATFALVRTGNLNLVWHKFDRTQITYLVVGVGLLTVLVTLRYGEGFAPYLAPELLAASLLWFATGIFIGIGQELTFRGLLLGGLQRFCSPFVAWALSIFIFVIAPLHSYRLVIYWLDGNHGQVVFLTVIYFIAGVLFTWIRLRTRSLIVPGLIHGAINALTWLTTFTLVAQNG